MMEYVGKGKFPESSAVSGYWVRGSQVIDVTNSSHVRYILDNPDDFEISSIGISELYKKYHEPLGFEGKAREELIKYVSSFGWVRVRHYITPYEYWSIQCDSTKKRKETIDSFLWWAIEHKLMSYHDTVTILGYDDPMDHLEFDYKNGGISKYLEESRRKNGKGTIGNQGFSGRGE